MKFCGKLMFCLVLSLATSFSFGQGVTTASMSGLVTDANGDGLPGAVVSATHEPTGTKYNAVTRANGRFSIFNMRVGGPYKVTVTMTGFRAQTKENIFLKLGENLNLQFKLQLDSVEESLTVVAESNPIINPSVTGAQSNVPEEALETLPTINRSIEDFARLNPYFSTTSSNGGQASLTVAGRSNRYNNILIDGAVNNDLFGLSATGSPGGQAEAQPISLEAISEIQLLVAPYDIRQGGFTGGGVNAVTKNGTNDWSGSVFHYTRTESWIGDGPDDRPFGNFEENQTGLSFGGPIIKDKAFFFLTYERKRRDRPTGFAVRQDGAPGTGVNFGRFDEVSRIRDIFINNYNFDPGGLDEVTRNTDSDNLFFRFDFNLNDTNQLTVRHNYIDAENLVLRPGSRTYEFPSHGYLFPNETNSTVVQWNSAFGSFFNEFRISYQTIRDARGQGIQSRFPYVTIRNLSGGGSIEAGTERFSTANNLDQDIIEITNDLTFYRGNHTITIGTHNEFFSFDNLFIRENFGSYVFQSIDDFERGWASEFNRSFANNPNDRSAKFDVAQLGFYAGDQWAVNDKLNMTFGLRVDVPLFPDKPTANPVSVDRFGLRTDQTASSDPLFSPRIGFNYDVLGDGSQQLRGGVGIFSGRAPYVWISNQYSNTGIEFTRLRLRLRGDIDENNNVAFNPDPNNQPTSLPGSFAFTNEIDLIDPDFELPQLFRANIAYDRELGFWGVIGTAEMIYSKTLNDILYQDLNQQQVGTNSLDGRPTYDERFGDLTNVIYLTNTSKGDQFTGNVKLEKPFNDNWYAMTSYTYGDSSSVNDGTSSQAYSNWRFNETTGNPNNPVLGTSDFDVKHRFNVAVSYEFKIAGNVNATTSLFYNAQSGRPYSTVFSSDYNGDGEFANDLLYVPASADEVIITGSDRMGNPYTFADFERYINADEGLRGARGSIVKRNASREPWRRALDFRFAVDVRLNKFKFQVTADIFNFMNLLDSDQGEVVYARNNAVNPVRPRGIDDATGKPIYQLNFVDPDRRFTQDDLRSRWQGQLGLRFSF